jgi:PhzF family phenazine biosynthesis protein
MRIRIVDAFTDRPFGGNPAGVVVLDAFPDEAWMQQVAAEVNLSETAFVHPLLVHPLLADTPVGGNTAAGGAAGGVAAAGSPGSGAVGGGSAHYGAAGAGSGAAEGGSGGSGGSGSSGGSGGSAGAGEADYALRWFTPAVEVSLCGHATLATAHVLHSTGATKGIVRFATRSGVLTAAAGDDGAFTLDFPTSPLAPVDADPRLAAALGTEIRSIRHTGPNTDDLLVEVADEATVRGLTPDLTALAHFERRGVVVTARAADPSGPYDFVSRFFGMAAGVAEDPVTGSAHTALAPFWSSRLDGRTELTGYQASARGGFVRVSLRGDRTHLTGKAVTVIEGDLLA